MIPDRDICWFDKFDYENMGMDDRWYIQNTVKMLTCFEMETKGYYTHDDLDTIYNKIYAKYQLFIQDAISNGYLTHLTPNAADYAGYAGIDVSYVVHSETTSFLQNDFIEYITINNKTRIDIEKLKRYLTGEEAPLITIPRTTRPEEQRRIVVQATDDGAGSDTSHTSGPIALDGADYRFEKTDKGWKLQYDDVTLNGVKDWTGMSYIELLLKHPGQKIFVLKLLELTSISGSKSDCQEGFDADINEISGGGINAWEVNDLQAIREYKDRLLQIEEQLTASRVGNIRNTSKIERLEKEKEAIEAQLKEGSYRPKDPVVEKARKSVSNAIEDAINKIGQLEGLSNYNDKPISRHLKRFINKGASCSYTAKDDNLPSWKFKS